MRTPRFFRLFFFTSGAAQALAMERPARERKTQAPAPACDSACGLSSRLKSAAAMPEINLGRGDEDWPKRFKTRDHAKTMEISSPKCSGA